ncbi:MAG: transposase [Pseudomonadota bacterium]
MHMGPQIYELLNDPSLSNETKKNLSTLEDMRRAISQSGNIDLIAINRILGGTEAFAVMRHLRWPKGIICPRCGSTRIQTISIPSAESKPSETATAGAKPTAINADEDASLRRHYECLNCRDNQRPSFFDDLTGLPMTQLASVRQWITSWYLLGLCSPAKVAQLLGVSLEYLLQLSSVTQEIRILPKEDRVKALGFLMQHQRSQQTKVAEKKLEAEKEELEQTRDLYFNTKPKSRK